MEPELKLKILKLNSKFVSDVKVVDVFPTLVQDGIMSSNDYSCILQNNNESGKMQCLLMLLVAKKNTKAYYSFHKALKLSHDWLADELDKVAITEEEIAIHSNDWKNKEVTNEMVDMLRMNSNLVRRWQALAHTLGMSDQCPNIQMQSTVFLQDLDECVRHLLLKWCALKGKDATLGPLIDALRREKFNDIADKLQETYCK